MVNNSFKLVPLPIVSEDLIILYIDEMKKIYTGLTLTTLILMMMGCTNFSATDLNPFFVTFEDPTISTIPVQGAPTHNIRDAWIFTQDQELGPFEMPVTLPIIDDAETTEFRIFPGIRENGREFVPIINQYMEPVTFSIDSEEGETYLTNLEFKYFDNVVFDFVEDFSGNHPFTLENDEFEGSTFTVIDDPLDSSNKVAELFVDADNPVIEVFTTTLFLPGDFNNNAYLEVEYTNTAALTIGIMKINAGGYLIPEYFIILNETAERNKIYLDIGNLISDPTVGQFSLLLNLSINGTSATEGEAQIDNIKLMHL